MLIPHKQSVAVMVPKGEDVLAIRRALDDDELPGVWGLPAGTRRGNETSEDVIRRIGRDKLHVNLTPLRRLTSGRQVRANYILEMELWEASMVGIPDYPEWEWAPLERLRPGAASGSLCCELAIKTKGRVSL